MSKFFPGWRRKIGVLTLVVACLLCSEWVRSWWMADEVRFSIGHRSELILSQCGEICWWGWNEKTTEDYPLLNGGPVWEIPHNLHKDERENRPRRRGLPVDARKAMFDESANVVRWIAPHAMFVMPLTLLSAWLLLGIRRTRIPGKSQVPSRS